MIIEAKSFAKVNPHLNIIGLRDDGYHLLDISFLSIDIADKISFRLLKKGVVSVTTDAGIPEKNNLCYEVAVKLRETCRPEAGVKINLEKNIPSGGGLGGGSSDAATSLICLNDLWNCGLSREELLEIGKEFGADIPFFFEGGYCVGRGIGHNLERRDNIFRDRLIPVLIPKFSQSTPDVYCKYDKLNPALAENGGGHAEPPPDDIASFEINNELQRAALELNPKLESFLNYFKGARTVQTCGLAGSGSSLFGVARAGVTREEVKADLRSSLGSEWEGELIIARPTRRGQAIRGVDGE